MVLPLQDDPRRVRAISCAGQLYDSHAKGVRKHTAYRGAKGLISMQLGRSCKNRL
jgi:hypothetical protein